MSGRITPYVFYAVWLVLSVYVMANFLSNSLLGDRYSAAHHFNALYSGSAATPYAYRVLMPKLARAATLLTPDSVQESVKDTTSSWAAHPGIRKYAPWLARIFSKPETAYPRLAAIVLVYASLLGYVAFMHRLATILFPVDNAIAWFAPVFALLALPAFSWPLQYIYDFPVLLLSAGCYYFLLTRKFYWYGGFFLLACLNKETAIFIAAFSAIWCYTRMGRPAYVRLLALQAVVYVAIQATIFYTYQDNPDWFDTHLYAAPVVKELLLRAHIDKIFHIAVLFFLLTYRWVDKPVFLKMGLPVLAMMYIAYLFFGRQYEYRVFFDILPLMVLLATHTLVAAAGFSQAAWFKPQGDRR